MTSDDQNTKPAPNVHLHLPGCKTYYLGWENDEMIKFPDTYENRLEWQKRLRETLRP